MSADPVPVDSPPGPLPEQEPPALGDDGVDRLALAGAERRLRARDQAEELEGVGHVPTPYRGSPTGRRRIPATGSAWRRPMRGSPSGLVRWCSFGNVP